MTTARSTLVALLALGLAAGPAAASSGPCTIDLSTGTTSGTPDPPGTVDPDWFVNFTPTGGAGPAFSVAPNGAWTNPGGASWIDPYNTTSSENDPNGAYEYQVNFTVDLATQVNLCLNIDVAVDDSVDLFLNGAYIATVNGFAGTVNVTATGPFVPGLNNVTANVTNGPTNGPTGLLVLGGVDFAWFPDCNGNCILDTDEDGADCDNNGVLDECEFVDCNLNGVLDACDILAGTSNDCNGNLVPDECESPADCNGNEIPDICEIFADCNGNLVPDECDPDCNGNGIPDDCEGLADCNGNGVPDVCEDLPDCNGNGTPDACEFFADCNGNMIPDECEPDCNANGIPDDCESGGPCATCVLDLSTGTTGEVVDPLGAVDPDWQFIYTPAGVAVTPAYSIAPAAGWVTSGGANWVDPYNTGGSAPASQDAAGDYGLEISFAVNLATQADLVLDLDVAVADTGVVLSLNGTTIATVSGSGGLTNVTVTNPALFLNGANTLRADAIHFGAWMGLLVDGELRWRERRDVSTGTTAGFPLPAGTMDPDWALNVVPGGGPGPAWTVVPAGAWMTAPGAAAWIDPFNTGGVTPDPTGVYEYELLFTLDYACEQNFELDVRVAADNRADLLLNGIPVGSTPGFGALTTINVTNQLLFVDGVNSLVARVENDTGPTGLLVDGDVLVACGMTPCEDCDGNGVHDAIDLVNGALTDSDNNGIPDECECNADVNGDGVVDIGDLLALLANWGPCPAAPAPCPWDIDGDGAVGVGDLLAVLGAWGPC